MVFPYTRCVHRIAQAFTTSPVRVLSVELTGACCCGSDSTVACMVVLEPFALGQCSFNFEGLETVFPFYGAG